MKYFNLAKKFAAVALCAAVFTSCDKDDDVEPLGDRGQTVVKLIGGGSPTIKLWSVDFAPVPQTLLAADLRRDVPNEAELNRTMTVTIKDDTGYVSFFNRDTVSTNPDRINPDKEFLLQLPAAYYTIGAATPKVGGQGGTYTITLGAGDFAKQIYITIPDATVMSTSSSYGLAFTITSADADGKISTQKTILYKIGAKNAYDGVYEDLFSNYHPSSNPGYTGDVTEVDMITIGATTCKIYWPDAAAYANPAILGGAFSYFGLQEPGYTVNPSNNAVTVYNAYAAPVTFYTMNSSYNNRYDVPTKTFYLKWGYSYAVPGVFDVNCREWTQKLTYLHSR